MNENPSRRARGWRRNGTPRPLWRRLVDLAIAGAILFALILLVARLDQGRTTTHSGTPVANDGDSLTINGSRFRLWGIDAPELHQSCSLDRKSYPCGLRARDALAKLVRGKRVDCTGTDRDRYERLLVICRVAGVDLNAAMVEVGWAVAYGGYESQEAQARGNRKGIWAGEFERPREFRRHPEMMPNARNDLLARVGDNLRKWFSSLFGGA